jgi:hypothetical protein
MSDTESKSISWAGTRASALSKKSGGPVVKKKSLSDDEVSALLHATSFPFSSSIGVFRLVRLERCVVVLDVLVPVPEGFFFSFSSSVGDCGFRVPFLFSLFSL